MITDAMITLDAAALDLAADPAHAMACRVHLVAQSRAALTLSARVAELEDENEDLFNESLKWEVHANALRDALEKANAAFNAWGRDEDGIHPEAWPAVEHLREVLLATPAASLAAHDAEVGLRVVSECAMTMRSRCSCSHCDENMPGWKGREIVERALAAQEVTK